MNFQKLQKNPLLLTYNVHCFKENLKKHIKLKLKIRLYL